MQSNEIRFLVLYKEKAPIKNVPEPKECLWHFVPRQKMILEATYA